MKNGEQDRQSLAVTSRETVILLPVEMVKQIYAMEQVQAVAGKQGQFSINSTEYSGYFLYDLLNQDIEHTKYAVLLQNDDLDCILFVSHIINVITLGKPCGLPFYMRCPNFSYIEACYALEEYQMGYQLNIQTLIHEHVFDQEVAYGI